jgi:hypothetical protein
VWRLQSWTTSRHFRQSEIIETSFDDKDKDKDNSYHADEDYNDKDDDNDNEASIVMGSVHSHMRLRSLCREVLVILSKAIYEDLIENRGDIPMRY